MAELKLITYKEERLMYFADQRKLVQKRYDRLEKAIKPDEPYSSERRQFLSDLGRELSFLNDVIKMLEDDLHTPKERGGERMNEHDAMEIAYKNGYVCGVEKFYENVKLTLIGKGFYPAIVKSVLEEIKNGMIDCDCSEER